MGKSTWQKLWSYENKMVVICMLCFGSEMFDRFAISNLSPFIMADLNMTNADLGMVMGVFAFAWAISGYFVSIISDITANKKRILGIVALLSSVLAFLTGVAPNLVSLLVIRFLMGLLEGPTFPLAQSFALAQSTPKRRGLNMGLISTTSMGLIANLIAPIALVALSQAFGWRVTFFLTFIPGAIVAYLIFKVLKEPDMGKIAGITGNNSRSEKPSFKDSLVIFKNRNVRTSMAFGIFIIAWNVGLLTYAPTYLVNFRGFDPTTMSYIMAAFGVGAVVWGAVVPGLSDKFGRKPAIIFFTFLSLLSPLGLLWFSSPVAIGICVFFGWSGSGVFALYQAAVLGESIDTKYATTAMASVQMVGDIGGAMIGVAIAGKLADVYGLQAPVIFAACCLIAATLIAFVYYETAPLIVAKRKASVKG